MKNIILLLTVFVLTFSHTLASSGIQFGIRANPNIGWLSPEFEKQADTASINNKGARLGISYGLAGDINLTENYGFALEFRLSHQGGNFIFDEEINEIEYRTEYNLKLQYFEFPILFKLKTNEIGYSTYFAQFGINTAIRFRPRADIYTQDNDPLPERENILIADDIKAFRFGLQVGAGIHYSLGGNTAIYGGLTYMNGFSNLFKERVDTELLKRLTKYSPLITNNYVSLDLGIMF